MGARTGRARVALRLARRSAVRSWGRSLLVVALVAAPVAALSGAAVLLPSTQSTRAEREANTLGHAQAVLTVVGTPGDHLTQGVEGGYDYDVRDGGSYGYSGKPADPRTVLAAGTPLIAVGSGAATFRTSGGVGSIEVRTGRTWDPVLAGGPYALLRGRAPREADEVLVSPAAAERLGVQVGGTIRMEAPATRVLRVVGLERDRALASDAETVFGGRGLIAGDDPATYYLPSTPLPWSTVQRLNAAGITAMSRAVLADPPVTAYDSGKEGTPPLTVALVGMALVFATLEVALLAGAAFAVSARLQQRTLAVVASSGGDRRVLGGVMSATGVVLGLAGKAVGLVLGIVGALIVMRVTDDGTWSRYPGVHLVWPLLAAVVLFGVLVGWISALVPARIAARTDVVAALRGARVPQRVRRRTPVIGLVLLVGGVAISLLGGVVLLALLQHPGGDGDALALLGTLALLGGGPVLAQLGVVLCAGLLLKALARLLAPAPLAARLAARDTSRNLGRAVPAVAVIMSTVFVAAFVMCVANTASIDSAAQWSWQAAQIGEGSVNVPGVDDDHPGDPDRAIGVLRQDLPVRTAAALGTSLSAGGEDHPSSRRRDAVAQVRVPEAAPGCSDRARVDIRDLRCGQFSGAGGRAQQGSQQLTVGSAEGLALLLGHRPSAPALAALDAGGAVALRSDMAPAGGAPVDWFTPKQLSGFPVHGTPVRTVRLRAVVDLPEHPLSDSLYVSAATARRLHVALGLSPRVLVAFSRTPTSAERDRADSALGALVNSPGGGYISIETGPTDYGALIAWWVLLACLVIAIAAGATAIGLARVDGKADDATFAALGAPPRIRRGTAAVQALLICGVGAVIGTALGLVPAIAIGGATQSYAFAPPVLQLVLTALGIPVVIAVGSALVVGRRADVARRPAMA